MLAYREGWSAIINSPASSVVNSDNSYINRSIYCITFLELVDSHRLPGYAKGCRAKVTVNFVSLRFHTRGRGWHGYPPRHNRGQPTILNLRQYPENIKNCNQQTCRTNLPAAGSWPSHPQTRLFPFAVSFLPREADGHSLG